jgi:hypothetical protein
VLYKKTKRSGEWPVTSRKSGRSEAAALREERFIEQKKTLDAAALYLTDP